MVVGDPPKEPELPDPFKTPSAVKFPKVVGWPEGVTPRAPAGFEVTLYAADLDRPRWLYVLPNRDVLVAESRTEPKGKTFDDRMKAIRAAAKMDGKSANRITLLRDSKGVGKPDLREVLIGGLKQPLGMLLLDDLLYIANTDSVVRVPYETGRTKIAATPELILGLPADGYNNHWTRNLLASADGRKIYVSVGSATNVDQTGEDARDPRRAAILQIDPDGRNMKVFASGIRNPVGMAWEPTTNTLFTSVNERDELGDDLVPDYLTSVKENGFYGWPYSYFGKNIDPRQKGNRPDLVKRAIVPDVALGSHTASLGLTWSSSATFPEKYRSGMFIGQRGSWNRSKFAGYRVAFVPFAAGKPSGPIEDFLTGFIKNDDEVHGQPVGVAFAADGALLVCDETSNCIWRVAPKK